MTASADIGRRGGLIGRWAMRGLTALILCAVALMLYRLFHRYSLEEVLASAATVPGHRLALAGGFAAASYACLTLFDFLALRAIGSPLPYRRAALASFVGLSIGHNVGFAALSSGAIRYRFYSRWGLSPGDVARLILYCAMTVGLGLAGLGGLALLVRPDLAQEVTGLAPSTVAGLGVVCLTLPVGYLVAAAVVRRPLAIRQWSIELPAPRIAFGQVLIGPVNFACVAACLHQAIAGVADVAYPGVAAAYVIANVTSLVTHVPGGLGVIEGVVLFLLPGADLIGALLVFRIVYYFVPLLIGSALFGLAELLPHGRGARPGAPALPTQKP